MVFGNLNLIAAAASQVDSKGSQDNQPPLRLPSKRFRASVALDDDYKLSTRLTFKQNPGKKFNFRTGLEIKGFLNNPKFTDLFPAMVMEADYAFYSWLSLGAGLTIRPELGDTIKFDAEGQIYGSLFTPSIRGGISFEGTPFVAVGGSF